jgi:hypothetical protein
MKLCGIYLNRGRYISVLSFIPIGLTLVFGEEVFLLMGIDAAVANHAQLYIYSLIPFLIM